MVKDTDTISISISGTLPCVPFLDLKNKILGKKYNLSIAFVSPAIAQNLNIKYRNKNYVPNTLSFQLSKNSGEIILCRSVLRKQYKKFNMNYEKYLTFISIHSMLHLKGFKHGSTMENEEKKLLIFFSKKTNETKNNSRD